jgi:hypothetical protein
MRATCIKFWYCNQLGAVDVPVAENPLCSGDAVYKELACRAEECGFCAKSNTTTFNNKGTNTNSRGTAAGELNMAHSSKADRATTGGVEHRAKLLFLVGLIAN